VHFLRRPESPRRHVFWSFFSRLLEAAMIWTARSRFHAILTLLSISLSVIVLVAMFAVPAYGQASGTWAATGSLNLPRIAHTATLLANGQVLVAGGEDSHSNRIASAELYNPATGKWTVTGSLATPRIDHTATLLANGEVLVAGGVGATYSATAELYNPSTGQWKTTGSMTMPRAFAGAALMRNGKVLVAGGSNLDGTSNATAEIYDPSTGKWTATTAMPSGHNAPATLLLSGEVLVSGGGGVLYNPSTAQWTATGPLYYSVTGGSAVLLPNADVLMYGNKFSCYAAQFYNPSTNTWARTMGQCGNSISFGPLVLLGTGKVLLAGDAITYSGHTSATARCALYDPSTNTWTPTGSLLQASLRTATVLPNGKVLSVGGSDAELYTP
jgi:N-acetylneuraminic acid mutarotase